MRKKKLRQSFKIFDEIKEVRKKNNENWMDLLKLAYISDSKSTIKILSRITKKDSQLTRLADKLKKITNK